MTYPKFDTLTAHMRVLGYSQAACDALWQQAEAEFTRARLKSPDWHWVEQWKLRHCWERPDVDYAVPNDGFVAPSRGDLVLVNVGLYEVQRWGPKQAVLADINHPSTARITETPAALQSSAVTIIVSREDQDYARGLVTGFSVGRFSRDPHGMSYGFGDAVVLHSLLRRHMNRAADNAEHAKKGS